MGNACGRDTAKLLPSSTAAATAATTATALQPQPHDDGTFYFLCSCQRIDARQCSALWIVLGC